MRQLNNILKNKAVVLAILLTLQASLTIAQTDYKSVEEAQGVSVGTQVKNFKATDQHGETFDLYTNLKKGPVVLLFYRGHWCPVCNKHLSSLQDSLQLIYDKGASVAAISPEKPALLKKTANKTSASFTLLYDKGYAISDAFDVTFMPDDQVIDAYNTKLDANLVEAHSDESQRLPIPATYIINKERKVVWRHFNPDYKKRASTKQILEVLKELQ